jgi:hypothetical protein
MSYKPSHSEKCAGQKTAGGHGNFKHKTKPANLKAVLVAYGMKHADYERVRSLVFKDLAKVPAHAR